MKMESGGVRGESVVTGLVHRGRTVSCTSGACVEVAEDSLR